MNNIKKYLKFGIQVLLIPIFNLLYFLSCLIAKDNNLWLFSAWFGNKFSDNPKYLLQYILTKKNIRAYWLTKDYKLYKKLKKEGVPSVYAYSPKGMYFQIKSGVIIFSHSAQTEYTSFLIGKNTKKINLYHGVPIKFIENDSKYSKSYSNIFKKITFFIPYLTKKFDLFIAIGTQNKKIFQSAFKAKSSIIKITGFPRNDHLLKYQKISSIRKVLYLPTFRGSYGSEYLLFKETKFNFDKINTLCEKLKIKCYICKYEN